MRRWNNKIKLDFETIYKGNGARKVRTRRGRKDKQKSTNGFKASLTTCDKDPAA